MRDMQQRIREDAMLPWWSKIHVFHPHEQDNFRLPLWSWEDGTVFHHTLIKIRNCVWRYQRRRNYSHNITYSSNKRVSKASIHSSASRLPKMHRATCDRQVIKRRVLLVRLTENRTASYSKSVLIRTGDLSPISHMIWEIIACYDFSDHMRNRRCNRSHMISRQEITRFSAISVFTLRDFSPRNRREITERNHQCQLGIMLPC